LSVKFYLGTHVTKWLWELEFVNVPLFVSRTQIGKRKKLKPVTTDWALDSGAFTELLINGKWTVTPRAYADMCLRLRDGCGRMDFCAIQDWMCEKQIIEGGVISGRKAPGTGLSLKDHQKLTVESYFTLKGLEPDLPFLPVIQGFELDEYLTCIDMYKTAGLDLKGRWVGVGSVCRRQGTNEIAAVLKCLWEQGILLHGFGVKIQGLEKAAKYLHSADSMAWSYGARMGRIKMPECVASGAGHLNCASCHHYALHWLNTLVKPAIEKGMRNTNSLTPNIKVSTSTGTPEGGGG
jgi:hypothetical protein